MRAVATIKEQIAKYEKLAKTPGLDPSEKSFMEDELKDLEKELKEVEGSSAKKPAPKKAAPKKAAPKKAAPKKAAPKKAKSLAKTKSKTHIVFQGKKIYEDDANYCSKLVEAWKERREKAKKSDKKRKTKPVTQKIAADVAQAVKKGIDNVSAAEIKKNPKVVVDKMERLEAAGKEFLDAFKNMLGETITQAEIKAEFEGLDKVIAQIKKKYVTSK